MDGAGIETETAARDGISEPRRGEHEETPQGPSGTTITRDR